MNEILKKTANASEKLYKAAEGDFVKDGLIYCGKCKTPRQVVLDGGYKVFCNCKCRAEAYEEEERRELQRKREKVIRTLREVAFPTKAQTEWTFENAKEGYNDKLQDTAKKYADEFLRTKGKCKGLLLFGETGVGKSYACVCIGNEVINHGYSVLYRTLSHISRELQATYDEQQEVFEELANVDLLILDDIGTERDTPYMREIKYEVIDRRVAENKPMLITTNLSRETLANSKDISNQRIFSRFFESCLPIAVEGKDLRRKILIDSADEMKKKLGILD